MPKTASNTKTNRTCFGGIVNTSASDISVCNWFNTSTSFLTVQLTPIRTSCDWKISHNLIPLDDGNTKIMRGYRMNYILCAFILNLINTWKLNAINFFFTSTTLIRLQNVLSAQICKSNFRLSCAKMVNLNDVKATSRGDIIQNFELHFQLNRAMQWQFKSMGDTDKV